MRRLHRYFLSRTEKRPREAGGLKQFLAVHDFIEIIADIALAQLQHIPVKIQREALRKLFEVLVTSEEMLRAENLPGFFRIRADGRDLNYDNYFSRGNSALSQIEPYTSHNTERLDLDGMKQLLKKLKLFGGNY